MRRVTGNAGKIELANREWLPSRKAVTVSIFDLFLCAKIQKLSIEVKGTKNKVISKKESKNGLQSNCAGHS